MPNINVYCRTCGASLCGQSEWETNTRSGDPSLYVEPCQKCLDCKYEEGHNEGVEDEKNNRNP